MSPKHVIIKIVRYIKNVNNKVVNYSKIKVNYVELHQINKIGLVYELSDFLKESPNKNQLRIYKMIHLAASCKKGTWTYLANQNPD